MMGLSAFRPKNGTLSKLVLVFGLTMVALSQVGHASPTKTSTLTVRLDDSGVPLFGGGIFAEAAAVQVRVMQRDQLVRAIQKPYRSQDPGIKLIQLTKIPTGAISVVLEGLDRKGDVVAFSVQDLVLTSEPGTVTFTPPIPEVEYYQDLGLGFRYIQLMVPVQTDFESVGHFGFLYLGDKRLGGLSSSQFFSLSPSGSHAIFLESSSGNLFLYRLADGQRTQLTSKFVDHPSSFEWDESVATVQVHFYKGLSESYSIPGR